MCVLVSTAKPPFDKGLRRTPPDMMLDACLAASGKRTASGTYSRYNFSSILIVAK